MERDKIRQFSIEQPTIEDVEGLLTMHVQSWFDAYPNESLGIDKSYIAKRMERLTSEKGRAKRAEIIRDAATNSNHYMQLARAKDGIVVGFVDAKIHDGIYELEGLYIDKSTYGSGLAHQLTDGALDFLGRDNEIRLTVVAYNARAQKFYHKMGFEIVEGSEHLHKDTIIPVVDMIRKGDTR